MVRTLKETTEFEEVHKQFSQIKDGIAEYVTATFSEDILIFRTNDFKRSQKINVSGYELFIFLPLIRHFL